MRFVDGQALTGVFDMMTFVPKILRSALSVEDYRLLESCNPLDMTAYLDGPDGQDEDGERCRLAKTVFQRLRQEYERNMALYMQTYGDLSRLNEAGAACLWAFHFFPGILSKLRKGGSTSEVNWMLDGLEHVFSDRLNGPLLHLEKGWRKEKTGSLNNDIDAVLYERAYFVETAFWIFKHAADDGSEYRAVASDSASEIEVLRDRRWVG